MLVLLRAHFCAVLFAVTACTASAGEQVNQGDIAPNWILTDLQGQVSSLYEGAEQGKWTVMVFWASWCSKSEQLIPVIEQLNQEKGDSPVAFYLMNVWEDKDPAAVSEQQNYELPVVRQAEHLAKRYGVRITPGVVVISPDKRIHYLRQSGESVEEVTANLKQILDLEQVSLQ